MKYRLPEHLNSYSAQVKNMAKYMKRKPKPPTDFWSKLDAEISALHNAPKPRPADSYTREEIREKYKWTMAQAHRKLQKLVMYGKIKRQRVGTMHYYSFTGLKSHADSMD